MEDPDQWTAWQAAYDPLQEGILIVEVPTGTIRFANERASQLVGVPASVLRGQAIQHYATTLEDECFWGADTPFILQGIHSFTSLTHADGRIVPIQRRVAAFKGQATPCVLVSWLDRTEQAATERTMDTLLSELRATLDSAADGVLVCDLRGAIRAFNERFVLQWQVPRHLLLERNDTALHQWMKGRVVDVTNYLQTRQTIALRPKEAHTHLIALSNGNFLEERVAPQWQRGQVTGRVTSYRDVTRELKEQANARLAARVLECSPDAIFVTDECGKILHANPAFDALTGLSATQSLGLDAQTLFKGPNWMQLLQSSEEGDWLRQEVRLATSEGKECVAQLTWVGVREQGKTGQCTHSVGFLRDLTQQRAANDRIHALAYRDTLTGLANRLYLTQRMQAKMTERAQQSHAVLSLDLDHFKRINESLGQGFGDQVIQLVVKRIEACLRPSDVLARIGGDEFAIYLQGANREVAKKVATRVLTEMQRAFELDSVAFSVQCSIGAAIYPEDADSMELLIQHADTAMYRMKERGRAQFGFYERSMDANMLTRMQLDHALRQALGSRQIQVYYQPQISLVTGEIIGAEALVRWTDPQRGPISPGVFIPIAEETGFIVTLGAWVLEQSIADAARCLRAGTPLAVSVNVSALEFRQPHFVERLDQLLKRYSLPSRYLELELTESVLLQNTEEVSERLHQIARLGVSLAVDDFGTGYSSLSYLKTLPIRKLKIDQSFIRGIPQDSGDSAIVRAVVHMGKALGLELVAEGVETEAQRAELAQLECHGYQGYLYAPALPFDSLRSSLLLASVQTKQLEMQVAPVSGVE